MTRERAGTADLNLIYFPPLQLLFWSCNNDGLLFLHPGVEVLASAGDNVLYFSLLELINLIMRPFFFFFCSCEERKAGGLARWWLCKFVPGRCTGSMFCSGVSFTAPAQGLP